MERAIEAEPFEALIERARGLVDLAQPRLGTQVIYANDDFFAAKERMIEPTLPTFYPDRYDDNGKWMDGWETRRRRVPGHDHAVLRLGVPGRIRLVDMDTSFFTGNFAPAASLEGCFLADGDPDDTTDWWPLVERSDLKGDSHHLFNPSDERVVTHLRLHIFPDGGIARLRLFGEIHRDWSRHPAEEEVDLVALENGGRTLFWSDAHYGDTDAILSPGRGVNMGDGWETRRRREPGNDWIIIALGCRGRIARLLVDTAHYKGNFPASCKLEGLSLGEDALETLLDEGAAWQEILPQQSLQADHEHHYEAELQACGPVTHLRLQIYPDGGISRLRAWGTIEPD